MDITNETIDKLADLAKLEFSVEERENLKKDLSKILSYIETLNQVDTEGVEPLIFMSNNVNALREDIPGETILKSDALKNAPSKDSDYFKVPKFIEK
jgi:aspartyl-tRNA(Asn)/glutamyl-tRNA(Gln) amidotransferase subunit C